MKKKLLFLIVIALIGCKTGQYQAFNDGVGYQSQHQNDNIYHVSYTGSSTTKVEKINDYVLLRCAELTLENGYKYFVILDARNNRNEVSNSRNLNTTNLVDERLMINAGPDIPGSAAGARPLSEMTIELFNTKPETIAYDAAQLVSGLQSEYNISQ